MNTNDTIIGVTERGSFHFPIEFNMFHNHQYIPDATFDTGCSHSLISARSLNIGNKSIVDIKRESLYDMNVRLGIGKGVESKVINTDQLKSDIRKINDWKEELRGKDRAAEILRTCITKEMQLRILESKLIRYEYEASDYEIDGVKIGSFKVKVSFDVSTVNLIGMHIIRELYTRIFSNNNQIFLLAKKHTLSVDNELDLAMIELKEQLEQLNS